MSYIDDNSLEFVEGVEAEIRLVLNCEKPAELAAETIEVLCRAYMIDNDAAYRDEHSVENDIRRP